MSKLKRLPNEPVYDIGLTSNELDLVIEAINAAIISGTINVYMDQLMDIRNFLEQEYYKTLNI